MATLPLNDRTDVQQQFSRALSDDRIPCATIKADILAAITAIDQWADDNAAEFNTAIPQPARAALTSKQKVQLLFFVLRRRFEVS